MRYSLLISLLFLSACGPAGLKLEHRDPRSIAGVDSEFQPYIDTYLKYKGESMDYDIPIQFSNLEGMTVGLCTRYSTGERQVEIDKDKWKYLSEGERLNVMFHEFGHCDLNRDHVATFTNGWPTSIMYPYVFSLYEVHMDYYAHELFSKKLPPIAKYKSNTNCVHDVEVNNLAEEL